MVMGDASGGVVEMVVLVKGVNVSGNVISSHNTTAV